MIDEIAELRDEYKSLSDQIGRNNKRLWALRLKINALEKNANPLIDCIVTRTMHAGRVERARITGLRYEPRYGGLGTYEAILIKQDGSDSQSQNRYREVSLGKWSEWRLADSNMEQETSAYWKEQQNYDGVLSAEFVN